MAVLAEAISVIIKIKSIEKKFFGGWEVFETLYSSRALCTDGELARIGFMSPNDTKEFVQKLEKMRLKYLQDGKAVDIVIADQQRGLAAKCDWAQFGRIPFDGDVSKLVPVVRSSGSTCNQLHFPDGWNYENSLSNKFKFVESNSVKDNVEFLRRENNKDVYRDKKTGEILYITNQRIKPE